MNRVYKVIWSKAKHCYVVTSEIARSVTKSASSARSASRKGAAVLAMAALLFTAGGVLGEAAANVTDVTVNKPGNVITVTKDGGDPTPFTIDNVDNAAHAKEADYATAAKKAYSDGNGLTFEKNYAKIADVEKDYVKKTDAQVTNLTASGNVSAGSFTNGAATMSNGSLNGINQINATGNIVTTSNMKAHDITAEVTIKGETINAATGTFSGAVSAGSLNVTNKLEAGSIEATGKLEAGSIEAKGNLKGDSLTVTNNASVGGQLTAGTLAAAGNNFTVGADGNVVAAGVNAGAGTIKTTGAVETGTLKTDDNAEIGGTLKAGATTVDSLDAGSGLIKTDGTVKAGDVQTGTLTTTGNVTIGGALTVTGKLNMDEIDMTKNGIVGDNNVTASTKVAAGEITSYKKATSTKAGGGEKESAIDYDEKGTSTWAKATDADGKWNKSSLTVEGKGIKSIATDGTNNASTNLSNKGFNTYASDGKNKTYTKQTATDIKNTAEKGMISNTAKNLVNTASENMTNTVGKNLTTTVGGDSSLTAENITNEAKNKITNKALDVETDAASSIVSKVSNDYGSNTSTQLSHQTMEEMKAEGKTASYLRGAAEEKSQLTDGAKKTTIDTVAGQTNTNITEGKNVSNSLQKADQIASSVTDGTNTTVVNQNAGSLASSITDGTKANNTSSTVDKSEQLIKVDDTHFYAETRTAGSAVEALKSDGNTIISAKDAVTGTVSSAVTDGATITGISQNAKDISLSAAGGTIASGAKNISNTAAEKLSNSAADIENKASKSILNQVGENTSWKMMDGTVVESVKDASGKTNQTTTTAADTYQFVKDGDNTLAKRTSSTNDNLNITDGNNTYTKITTATSNKQTVTGGTETASTNLTKEASNTLIKNGTQSVLDHMAADTSYTVMNENGNGSRRQQTASEILDRVTDGTDTSEVKQTASEVATSAKDISNTATDKITNITGDNTVTSDTNGTTFANEKAKTPFEEGDERGTKDNTKITGNKVETGKVLTDFAEVANNLDVKGSTTLGRDGNTNLTVNSKSEFKDTVKMDSTLEVNGTSTLTGDVTMESNATVTKDLTVKGTSEFVHRADFRDNVFMDENLTVAKETRTDTLYVDHDGYVGGNLNVDGNIETHDAVLSADSRQVVTGRQLYQTNERVDRLDNRIKKVGANAAALAALRPGDFNPDDKFSIAAGFGSYRNANAAALGLFYRPNENVLLSLGTSFGDGENMVNAGVSVKFGRGKSMAERRKEMADEVSSMRDEMRSQDERIAELEEMLKKQSELIEKLSKES